MTRPFNVTPETKPLDHSAGDLRVESYEQELVDQLRAKLPPGVVLVRRLGSGGMGTVFLARDTALKRLVAVKVLSPELSREEEARARFEREAEAVAAIAHPNVVAVYSVGELRDGTPYFLMQYVSGRSCSERLKADGTFDVESTKRILGEVASALAAAHRQHIVHRDIKPGNILIDDASGHVVVSDFGIAAVREHDEPGGEAALKLTRTGTMVGTPAYMSPEQLLTEPVTEKTDIYSLGLLGYELLTGRSAYRVSSPAEIVAAHLRDPPIRLSSVVADIDPEFESLLESCLSKDPEARPDADDVAKRLAAGDDVVLEWPPPGLEFLQAKLTRPRRYLALGAVGLCVPLMILAGFERGSLWRELLPAPAFLGSLIAVGGALILLGAFHVVRLGVRAARLIRAGHGWGTVAEVLVDQQRDTGALITGTREYSALSPAERGRYRTFRLARGFLLLAAATLPIVQLIAALPLAARAPTLTKGLIVAGLAVSALATLVALGLRDLEERRLRDARRRMNKGPSGHLLARVIAGWRAAFEEVRRGQHLGSGTGGRPRTVVVIAGGLAVLVSIAAMAGYSASVVAIAGQVFYAAILPKLTDATERVRLVEAMVAYRLPIDSTITAERAGQALNRISWFGRTEPESPLELPPAQPLEVDSDWMNARPPFRETATRPWYVNALADARRGLNPEQRAFLRRVAGSPLAAEFTVLATAGAADYQSAAWPLPLPDTVDIARVPSPHFPPLKTAATTPIARAALHLDAGRVDSAETAIRAMLGAGFALLRGRTAQETLEGVAIVEMARDALATLYEVVGRAAEARAVTATALTRTGDPVGETRTASANDQSRRLRAAFVDSNAVPSLRWALAMSIFAYEPCSDLHQLLFGPDAAHRDAYARARQSLVKNRTDSILFVAAERASERRTGRYDQSVPQPSHFTTVFTRAVDRIVGGRRFEACTSFFDSIN